MMAGWARVGTKVVCVDDSNWERDYPDETPPLAKYIYTIRGVHRDGDAIWVTEIVNTPHLYSTGVVEVSFLLWRFRPLVTSTLEADSAMFLSLVQRMDAIRIAELALDQFEL